MCGPAGELPLFPVKTLKVPAGSAVGFAAAGQSRSGDYDESKDFKDVCVPLACILASGRGVVGSEIDADEEVVRSEFLHVSFWAGVGVAVEGAGGDGFERVQRRWRLVRPQIPCSEKDCTDGSA